MQAILKYHRTPHIEGSKLQPGDTAEGQVSLSELRALHPDCHCVIEEKLDGANSAVSFSADFDMRLQSRGHFLQGGAKEAQFNLFKEWAAHHEAELLDTLEDRYQIFGEWTFAKHTQFYDALPAYFHEFDIWDRKEQIYLSTAARHELLAGTPILAVPIVGTEWPKNRKTMTAMVGLSAYRTPQWRENLALAADRAGIDPEVALAQSGANDPQADLAEGLYLKIEKDERVVAFYKFVRPGFLQTIEESGSHWSARPIIRNMLSEGVDIFCSPKTSGSALRYD